MNEKDFNPADLTEVIRSGQYYEDSRRWYSSVYHTIFTERCYLIIVTLLACIAIFYASRAFFGFLPLSNEAMVLVPIQDSTRDRPKITRLALEGEEANSAVLRHLLQEYVSVRESYFIDTLSRNFARVHALSSPQVFKAFQTYIDTQNPLSPLRLYERHTNRRINVTSYQLLTPLVPPYTEDVQGRAQVGFVATLQRNSVSRTNHYVADIAFSLRPITVNQTTGEVTPMQFVVTGYSVREIVMR